jgi:NAD(P)-dependent dehydrogenase (short-subunit alcohol dehydrogenase family)
MVGHAVDLTGSVAVVTGVRGRLGPVWARALLGAGASVVGLDLTDEPSDRLRKLLADHNGRRLTFARADVTDSASLRLALDTCLSVAGPPTILVNNAGIDQPPSAHARTWLFEDLPGELSAAVLDVNAHGVLRTCQVFGAEMARRRHGSVINIGSLYGTLAPDPRLYDHLRADPPFLKPPAYGMSKAGVAALTRYLAALWGPSGVRVNTLSPGGVLGDQDPDFLEKFGSRVPLRRLAGPADLVGPLLFLASDLASYVTGVELIVDGGYSCW